MGPVAQLFPSGDETIAAAELFGSTAELLPLVDSLHDAERATLDRSVDSRRADYAAARACVRTALARLDLPPAPVLNRPDRSPIWPDGVVGSLTHTKGYAAAVVARADRYAGVGIDAEPDLPLPAGVGRRVLTDADRAMLAELSSDGPHRDRLVFCVKEATYKVWQPLMGSWLGFEDADVRIHPDGTCTVSLRAGPLLVGDTSCGELHGRWVAADGLLGCAIAVRQAPGHG